MSRQWLGIAATTVALALVLGFFGCDCMRPDGRLKLEASEDDFVQIDDGWFVFGGQPTCAEADDPICAPCDDWKETRLDGHAIKWRLAYLTGYKIMKREVTNAEYLECMQTTDPIDDRSVCGRPDDCSDVPLLAEMAADFVPVACRMARDDVALEPVRDVDWLDARRYCKWRYRQLADNEDEAEKIAKRADLPTEAQWERAAVGPAVDGQMFVQPALPVADENVRLGCSAMVIGKDGSCVEDTNNKENDAYGSSPHPYVVIDADGELMRKMSVSVEGLADMVGNVSEWVLDEADDGEGVLCASTYYGGAMQVDRDCYGCNEDATCANSRIDELGNLETDMWCNPVVGKQDLDITETETNFDRVVKGGNYNTKKACEATPRTRRYQLEPEKEIGFRCVIWDEPPGTNPHGLCGTPPPAPDAIGAEVFDCRGDCTHCPDLPHCADAGVPDAAAEDI